MNQEQTTSQGLNPALTERLYLDFHEKLLSFVRSRIPSEDDAGDIVHDVFTRIHTRSADLAEVENLTGWIYRVTRNAIIDHHRSRAAASRATETLARQPEEPLEEPAQPDPTEALARCLAPFIEQLPDEFRTAVTSTALNGLSQKEAAAEAGISVSGMKSRVQRGRAKLGCLLRQCCQIELDGRRGIIDFEARNPAGHDPCKGNNC